MRPSEGGFMFYKNLLVLFCFLLLSGSAFGQTTSVSNKDLSKFRDRRVAAEKEYLESYKRLGMPSPEEIETDRIAYIKNTQELSARLRKEQAEREATLAYNAYPRQSNESYQLILGPGPFTSYYGGYLNNGSYRQLYRRTPRRGHQTVTWRAAGGFVYYEPGGLSSAIWNAPTLRRRSNFRFVRR